MAVVSQLLRHLMVPGVEAARIVVPGVGQSLIHQLVAIPVPVHLRPVVLGGRGQTAQSPHGGGGVGGAGGHDGRPLVRPVRVFLHVLGQVGLLQADTVLVYWIYNKSAGGAWLGDGMLTAGQYS